MNEVHRKEPAFSVVLEQLKLHNWLWVPRTQFLMPAWTAQSFVTVRATSPSSGDTYLLLEARRLKVGEEIFFVGTQAEKAALYRHLRTYGLGPPSHWIDASRTSEIHDGGGDQNQQLARQQPSCSSSPLAQPTQLAQLTVPAAQLVGPSTEPRRSKRSRSVATPEVEVSNSWNRSQSAAVRAL